MTHRADHLATPLGLLSWRPRTDEDQGLLRALFASYRADELAMIGGDAEQQQAFVDLQLRARDHHRDATRPGAELAIVTLDGIAVGQLDVHRTEDSVEVLEIALVPGLRGHGLGTALLGRVLAEADDAGVPVRLHVEPGNPAQRLYERLGFAVVAIEPMHRAMARPVGGAPDEPEPAPVAPAPAPGPGPATGAPPQASDVAPGAHQAPIELVAFPTYDDLAAHVGATVACLPAGPTLTLTSVEARPRGAVPGGRMPYVALFTGPADAPLPQGVHRVDLPVTGPTDAFLVPVGPAGDGTGYELVVS